VRECSMLCEDEEFGIIRDVWVQLIRALRMRRQLMDLGTRQSQISFEVSVRVTPWEEARVQDIINHTPRQRVPEDGIKPEGRRYDPNYRRKYRKQQKLKKN
jgi:hypothetical protein